MNESPVKPLCAALRNELETDPAGPGVAALLEAYVRQHDDWRRYRLFDDRFYARNLIESCDLYELIVICWKVGQSSPIHNHAGQHCWMAVLEGEIEEVYYEHPKPGRPGPLRAESSRRYAAGEVSYIHDDIALHVIRTAGERPAASLHMYSKPIKSCNVYCPDTGRIHRRDVSYYSVDGRRVG